MFKTPQTPSMLYALCAVVAMQKYYWLDRFAPPMKLGTFYAMKNWHDVAELLALSCLDEHRAAPKVLRADE